MYIIIGSTTYTTIKELSFVPETDITGSELPVNQFSADIITTDSIGVGGDVYLYDDSGLLWAKFWLIDSYYLDDSTVRVVGQSLIAVLDRVTLPAAMYTDLLASTLISDIFSGLTTIYGSTVVYELHSDFSNETISGYAPEQTARERLQWVLMCIGAYCNQAFTDHLQFLPVSDTLIGIPIERTYYRPEVSVSDYVTSIRIVAYAYAEGTPITTDKYVEVNGTYYIETSQSYALNNPNAPATAPENVITIEDIGIINPDNVSIVLSRLATYYFVRTEVDAEILNNGDYKPGQRVWVATDTHTAYSGFIRSMEFSFGMQSKSRIHLSQSEDLTLACLTVNCMCGSTLLEVQKYYFPVGYEYEIETKWVEKYTASHHTVYYPYTGTLTGTLTEDTAVTLTYYMALDHYYDTKVLYVRAVDEAEVTTVEETEVLDIG